MRLGEVIYEESPAYGQVSTYAERQMAKTFSMRDNPHHALEMPDGEEWKTERECVKIDPSESPFFSSPEDMYTDSQGRIRERADKLKERNARAINICGKCIVRKECLADALSRPRQDDMIVAAKTKAQRIVLRRRLLNG